MNLETLNARMNAQLAGIYPGKRFVPGDGPERARVMLVGEAPGEREEACGRPFVGRAGKNLDEFLRLTGIERAQLYVTNVVKLRPTKISPAGRTVNRAPTRDEIANFRDWLRGEISIVAPEIVVTLGNTALRALAGDALTIGAAHGIMLAVEATSIFPMYHPASVIYNNSLRETYLADLAALARLIKRR